MVNKNQHVLPRNGGWAVRTEGNNKDTVQTSTQEEAIEKAREIAQEGYSEIIIYRDDGRIEERIINRDNHVIEEFYLTDRIVVTPNILHGKPRIVGTRIMVQTILELVASGMAEEEIVSDDYYPDLSVEDVRECVAFASRVIEHSEFIASNDHTSRPLYSSQIFRTAPDLGL